MNYQGVIIEESLEDTSCLKDIRIFYTDIEDVTDTHKTPWLSHWTLHTVEIPEDKIAQFADRISKAFDKRHPVWYTDFKNDLYHYIVFSNKVFKIDRSKPEEYKDAVDYGLSLGIPSYQLDFSPDIKNWGSG